MWIEPITCESITDNAITLCCTNSFSRKRIQSQYGELITDEFTKETGKVYRIKFILSAKNSNYTFPT